MNDEPYIPSPGHPSKHTRKNETVARFFLVSGVGLFNDRYSIPLSFHGGVAQYQPKSIYIYIYMYMERVCAGPLL